MATLTATPFQTFAEAKHESAMLGSNTIKICLSNTAPTAASDAGYTADISGEEISSGNGYTTGGETVSVTSSQSSGTFTLVGSTADVTWTASGGSIGPFQYCIMYDDTHASKQLICYWSLSSAHTITDGSTYTLSTNGTTLYSDAPA